MLDAETAKLIMDAVNRSYGGGEPILNLREAKEMKELPTADIWSYHIYSYQKGDTTILAWIDSSKAGFKFVPKTHIIIWG